jgi:hypothetical protein
MHRSRVYAETFDDGPGGWFAWASNALGPKPLEVAPSCVVSRSPWWIDYNHAPPGAGYLHLLFMLLTRGPFGEHQRETAGVNRFVEGEFPADFTDARLSLTLRGELLSRDAKLCLLVQSMQEGVCSGWILTGQPFEVGAVWLTQTIELVADPVQWTSLGGRHDRQDYYRELPLARVLADANTNILLVMFPLDVAPMGALEGDRDLLRPEKDYPVWRSRLPEGYVMLDEVRIEFPVSLG